jgi:molybdopterin synthase catalytic subunit
MNEFLAATELVVYAAIVAADSEMRQFADMPPPPQAGACVTFAGVVRSHDSGRPVMELEYQGHPSARLVLWQIAAQIAKRHPEVTCLRVAHRVGLLQIGDCALLAKVAAPRRGEAFRACIDLVEEAKRVVPVWKRQVFADGTEEWVNSP